MSGNDQHANQYYTDTNSFWVSVFVVKGEIERTVVIWVALGGILFVFTGERLFLSWKEEDRDTAHSQPDAA